MQLLHFLQQLRQRSRPVRAKTRGMSSALVGPNAGECSEASFYEVRGSREAKRKPIK